MIAPNHHWVVVFTNLKGVKLASAFESYLDAQQFHRAHPGSELKLAKGPLPKLDVEEQ